MKTKELIKERKRRIGGVMSLNRFEEMGSSAKVEC